MKARYYPILVFALLTVCASAAFSSGVLLDNGVLIANLAPGTLSNRSCGAAFDGMYYWTAEVGFTSGITLNQYDASGTLMGGFETGIDHRGLFVDASGNLYTNDYGGGGSQVYQYVGGTPNLLYTLSTNPNSQMECALRHENGTLYGMNEGTVHMYNFANGVETGSFMLSGYSGGYPANVQIAIANLAGDDYVLTYNDAGVCHAWDFAGNQVGECVIGVTGFDQTFSFSFTNGLLWVETVRNGPWNGYDIGLGGSPTAVEPATWGSIKARFE